MDQNGRPTKPFTVKELADFRRAHDKAQAELKKGQPWSWESSPVVEVPKPVVAPAPEPVPPQLESFDDKILTSRQAAEFLGYDPKSFMNAAALGKFPRYRLLGQFRYKRSELLGLLIKDEPK